MLPRHDGLTKRTPNIKSSVSVGANRNFSFLETVIRHKPYYTFIKIEFPVR